MEKLIIDKHNKVFDDINFLESEKEIKLKKN